MSTAVSKSVSSQRNRFTVADIEAAERMGEFYSDPYGFVMWAFPWGQAGTRLAKQSGPDTWQIEVLEAIGENVKRGIGVSEALPGLFAVCSGHGIGKTALISWIILWFIATREHPEIIVTAGKREQLSGKTWRELAKWHKLSIIEHWFLWTQTKLEHVLFPETWFAHAIAWSKNAPENFAGTHEEHVLLLFDEASAIDDSIWESADGAMTTPGAMWVAFGNPTKTTGRFAQCFGKFKHRWWNKAVDSRTAKMANRKLLDQWVEDHGEDSDFVRVRVRGLFPRIGDMQFIGAQEVQDSFRREAIGYDEFAKVLSVDVARHGTDQSVICRRQGKKVWKLQRFRIPNLMQIASRVAEAIDEFEPEVTFIDATGMGWGVVDRLHQMGYRKVIGIQVGETADQPERFFNKRMEIWWKMREWLRDGGAIEKDDELEAEMTEPEYWFDDKQRFRLESKDDMRERDLASPDGADALALSFAAPVGIPRAKRKGTWRDKLKKRRGRKIGGGNDVSGMAA